MKESMKENMKMATLLLLAASLSGCANFLDRMRDLDNGPQLSKIENPEEAEGYKPVSMPMPASHAQGARGANSLWKQGSTGFFKDQRAANIGDIITVKVSAKDAAKMENETEQKRANNTDSMGVGVFAGFEDIFPGRTDEGKMLDITSDRKLKSDAKIDRKESISMTMAAVVTQVLPNGNLVIVGSQEIRVNYELRQLTVKGVIRRADIRSDNSIESSNIAELRVNYGGRGTISDTAQPRYGRQLLDIIAPF